MFSSLNNARATYTSIPKIAILASGSGTNFENIVLATRDGRLRAEVVGLIVNVADAGAIGRAKSLKIQSQLISHKTFAKRTEFDLAVSECLQGWHPELVILAGWMRLASAPLLDAFPERILNIHPSLLPNFRGLHAIEQAIVAEVKLTGCTVHIVTPELDDGPIIAQSAIAVADTHAETARLIHDAEYELYPAAIQHVLNGRVKT